MPTQAEKPEFMLLLLQPNRGPHPTPEEMNEIMGRFSRWMDGMNAQGIVAGTSGLEVAGKILRGPRGASVTDGPFPEAKEIVGGYVIIKAADLDAAVEIARDCPGLDYRMAVEVRPVKHRHKA
jgi:hypothetical protein